MKCSLFIFAFFLLYFIIPAKISAQPVLKAGASQVNITPELGTAINGGFLPFYAKQIHDSLYAKAVAFSNAKEKFVFVVVDIMAMDQEFISIVKELIKAETGLQPSQLMISSTHSHSTGAVISELFCQADTKYREWLPAKITQSVKYALQQLRPATIAWGKVDVPQHVSCRRWFMKEGFNLSNPFGGVDKVRMNPLEGSDSILSVSGTTDPQVGYLAVKGTNNKWITVITNYSLHYVGDFADNTISGDYFGEIGSQLKSKLKAGNDFVGIMTNGTSGDINSMDFFKTKNYPAKPFEKTKLIAGDITDKVVASLDVVKWQSNAPLSSTYKEIPLATRKPNKAELDTALKTFLATDYSAIKDAAWASKEMFQIYAFEQVLLSQYPDSVKLPVQAIRIGNGTIGTLPGEIFAETGLNIKKASVSKNYFTICLANANVGYIPPRLQLELGGYETWRCRSSYMEAKAENALTATLLELIKKCNK